MKKIISFFAAGLLALGLVGCSGDLHDSEAIDMTQLFLRGNMNSWGATAIEAGTGDYAGKYTVKFTAVAAETQFAIATNDEGWSTAYRMKEFGGADCVAYTAAELDGKTVKSLYHGGGMSNATIETEIGTDYTVVIETDLGFIKVAVVKGEAPKDAYIGVDGTMAKMELLEKGSYKYAISAADSDSLNFQVLYDGEIFGVTTATVATDTEVSLTKTSPKVISATVEAGEPYNILLDTKGDTPKLTVEYASYKAFIAGVGNDWTFKRLPVYIKGQNIVTYTFEASATEEQFKIKSVGNWNSDDDTLFAGTELVANAGFDANEGGNNAKITGLTVGSKYTLVLDANDPDDVQCAVVGGEYVVYIAGGMNSWNFGATGILPGDDNGAYYEFEAASADCEFKVKNYAGWDEGSEIYLGATVTTSETVSGTEGNAKVTAAAGDRVYFYKNAAGKWCAKLVEAE
ncbi:MAG: hypothetical protein J6T34_05435 [Bacilli bacterium]|nr:hypothetical protein [Bacilli bacterium]